MIFGRAPHDCILGLSPKKMDFQILTYMDYKPVVLPVQSYYQS